MLECSNHIQHGGKARGLYAVTQSALSIYSHGKGGLTGLYSPMASNCTPGFVTVGLILVVLLSIDLPGFCLPCHA